MIEVRSSKETKLELISEERALLNEVLGVLVRF